MTAVEIKQIAKRLCEQQISYNNKSGYTSLVWPPESIVEDILTGCLKQINYDRNVELESKIGYLESKVFLYENIIAKSNFAPLIAPDLKKSEKEIVTEFRDGHIKVETFKSE